MILTINVPKWRQNAGTRQVYNYAMSAGTKLKCALKLSFPNSEKNKR